MSRTFKSKRSTLSSIVVIATVVGSVFAFAYQLINPEENIFINIAILLVCGMTIVFLLWIFLDTQYQLDPNVFTYKSGPIKGKIDIKNINQIVVGQKWFVGLKPATGTNGLVIKYNRWDEIYISPMTNEDFIKEILKINSSIKILYLKKNT